jgi:hypothetical protein
MLCCEKAGAEDGRVNSISRRDEPREDPELTMNIWNHHAVAALLVRSAIVKVEDTD